MFNILESFYSRTTSSQSSEGFSNSNVMFPFILAFITVIILQLLLGKFLWNNYLVSVIPAVKPVSGIIDILAISFLFRLLFP